MMKTLKILLLCSAVSLLTALQSPAQDTLLGLYAGSGVPDLAGLSLNVTYASYDPSSGIFSVTGTAGGYVDPAGDSVGITGSAAFTINANISNSGYLGSGSTISVTGIINGGPEETLLAGNLLTGPQGSPAGSAPVGSAYDYINWSDQLGEGEFDGTQFAFTFNVTDGALAGDFGGANAQGVIELFPSALTPFGGWTTAYYDGGGSGAADVFPVPEPSSALLFLMGGAVWSVARRCRRSLFQTAV